MTHLRPWTDEDLQQATDWLRAGVPTHIVARRLQRTPRALRQALFKRGISIRALQRGSAEHRVAWARELRRQGWSLSRIAEAVHRSSRWVIEHVRDIPAPDVPVHNRGQCRHAWSAQQIDAWRREGITWPEIGRRLGIKPSTARARRDDYFRRFGGAQ